MLNFDEELTPSAQAGLRMATMDMGAAVADKKDEKDYTIASKTIGRIRAEDKRIIAELRRDQTPFTNGTRSIFTEAVIHRVAQGWVTNLQETEEEGHRLFGENYASLRYEDLLAHPFDEMQKLWQFLGVQAGPALEKRIVEEMSSNPDEEWQAKRNEDIASFLPKGGSSPRRSSAQLISSTVTSSARYVSSARRSRVASVNRCSLATAPTSAS